MKTQIITILTLITITFCKVQAEDLIVNTYAGEEIKCIFNENTLKSIYIKTMLIEVSDDQSDILSFSHVLNSNIDIGAPRLWESYKNIKTLYFGGFTRLGFEESYFIKLTNEESIHLIKFIPSFLNDELQYSFSGIFKDLNGEQKLSCNNIIL